MPLKQRFLFRRFHVRMGSGCFSPGRAPRVSACAGMRRSQTSVLGWMNCLSPLSLRLPNGRVRPGQLLERLGQRLDLLKGSRDADPRQLTLRATIDWSYELLSHEEQQLFAALAVFSNGCTYEAAEAIAGADVDTAQSLLDKSLLRRRDSDTGVRYWMLTTINEYALEKLALRAELSELQRRHAEWYREQAATVIGIPGAHNPRAASTQELERFRDDYDNARAALNWAWRANEDELAIEIGIACCRYWLGAGSFPTPMPGSRPHSPRSPPFQHARNSMLSRLQACSLFLS